mgnify:CR=1 FL=1
MSHHSDVLNTNRTSFFTDWMNAIILFFPLLLIENPFSACLCNLFAMSFSRYTWVRPFFRSRWSIFQLASLLWYVRENVSVYVYIIHGVDIHILDTLARYVYTSMTCLHIMCVYEHTFSYLNKSSYKEPVKRVGESTSLLTR